VSQQQKLTECLTAAFQPNHLDVINESHQHNVPKGSESHFKVIIVSEAFQGQSLLARHRAVNHAAKALLSSIHAFSIKAYTPEEWQQRGQTTDDSPKCRGGSRHG